MFFLPSAQNFIYNLSPLHIDFLLHIHCSYIKWSLFLFSPFLFKQVFEIGFLFALQPRTATSCWPELTTTRQRFGVIRAGCRWRRLPDTRGRYKLCILIGPLRLSVVADWWRQHVSSVSRWWASTCLLMANWSPPAHTTELSNFGSPSEVTAEHFVSIFFFSIE